LEGRRSCGRRLLLALSVLAPGDSSRFRVPHDAAWCHWGFPGRSSYVPVRGRGPNRRPPMDAASLLGLPAGSSWPARSGRDRSQATAGPRQLPGAEAVAASRPGVQATPGSRRRRHEEIVDGGAGMTAPLLHLSTSAASKLTILLLKRCPVSPGREPHFSPHSFCLVPAGDVDQLAATVDDLPRDSGGMCVQ
jgi:hypothetical protein